MSVDDALHEIGVRYNHMTAAKVLRAALAQPQAEAARAVCDHQWMDEGTDYRCKRCGEFRAGNSGPSQPQAEAARAVADDLRDRCRQWSDLATEHMNRAEAAEARLKIAMEIINGLAKRWRGYGTPDGRSMANAAEHIAIEIGALK